MTQRFDLNIPDEMTLEDLEALHNEVLNAHNTIEARLAEAKQRAKNEAVAGIIKAMKKAGVDIYDVAVALGISFPNTSEVKAKEPKPKKEPAPPKFLNPITGETHSGRGQLPAWLKEARDAGKLEDFRIAR